MSLTFVIPAHNAALTLAACLSSVQRACEAIPDGEIIVVSNGSSDETEEIARRHANVQLISLPLPSRSRARNVGWRQARNAWVAFVDADVDLNSDWGARILETCDVAGCGGGQGPIIPAESHPPSLSQYRKRSAEFRTRGTYNSLEIIAFETPMLNTAACVYRRDALELVAGFDEDLRRHEDIDLSKRLVLAGWSLRAAPAALAHVLWHGSGWPGYLRRAFEVGMTKHDYNLKWFPVRSLVLEARIFANEGRKLLNSLRRYRETADFFWAQKFAVDLAQELGKIANFVTYWLTPLRPVPAPSEVQFLPSVHAGKFVSRNYRLIDVRHELRLLNVRKNQVLIVDSGTRETFLRFVGWAPGGITAQELAMLEASHFLES